MSRRTFSLREELMPILYYFLTLKEGNGDCEAANWDSERR